MLNIAVLAPMPSASATMATTVRPRALTSVRAPYRTSCSRVPMVSPRTVDGIGRWQVPLNRCLTFYFRCLPLPTMDFRHFVQLIAIGLQARVPMHITGFPGVGKTEFTKSLEAGFGRAGLKCKVFILVGSIREPQDFGGFPVSTSDGVRLLPMAWAQDARRLAADGHLVLDFLD